MATSTSKLDNYKLETEFEEGYVVHTTYRWEFAARRRTVSTWKHEKKIGVGASGSVWLQKEKGGRLRAVKELSRDSLPRTSFLQELLALAKLKDHDHLFVEFYGWYENSNHIFIAMEYIEYGDLSKYIKDTTARSRAKEITRQILEGLEILHEKGICHRDLKPQNILVASLDPIWVKIADFGTSKRIKNTALRTRVGTQGYFAPELLGLLPRRFRSKGDAEFTYALDMWSLGCFVHEILTSQTPFLELDDGFSGAGESGFTKSQPEIDMDSLYEYCQGKIDFPVGILKNSQVREEGIDFVKSLLVANPKGRLTAASALESPWLAGHRCTSDWYQNLEREFSSLGVELGLGDRERARLVKQKYKANIMQFLPATSAGFGVLLQQAATKGLKLAVLMLIKSSSGESIDYTTARKIFEGAAEARQLDTIKLLLDNKADLDNHIDIHLDAQTILQWAVEAGHYDVVKLFLDKKVSIDASINCLEAFRTAFRVGNIIMMRLLLENKTNVITLVNQEVGRKALQAMAERGDLGMAKLLVRNGADTRARAGDGQAALQAAAENGHIDMVKLLLGNRVGIGAKTWGEGNKALRTAIERGDTAIAGMLLEHGAKPGLEALRIAVASKSVKMVKLLLESGIKPNSTELQAAAQRRDAGMVRLLLEGGAKTDLPMLQAAAECGNIDMVKLLLKKGDIGPRTRGGWTRGGWTALQVAALSGPLGMVELLLRGGANVNFGAGTRYGRTALQVAAKGGRTSVVKLLLGRKAKVNARAGTEYGPTALRAAVRGGHIEVARLLLQHRAHAGAGAQDGRATLRAAIKRGDIEITKLLLKNGARPDTTTLQAAIKRGSTEITNLLLRNGAKLNRAALKVAAERGYTEIAKLLLGSGARPDTTILQVATKKGYTEIAKLLLENGAKPDTTTLQAATKKGYIEIAKLLLENGAKPDTTTLQEAIESGRTDIAKLLLENGAKPDITTLKAVAERGYIEIAKLLLENGAKADTTTLQTATKGGYTKIAKLLLRNGVKPDTAALQTAVASGNIRMAKLLLEGGVKVNPAMLLEVVQRVDIGMMKLLLDHGLDTGNGQAALQLAVRIGHINVAELLLNYKTIANVKMLTRSELATLQEATECRRWRTATENPLLDSTGAPWRENPMAFGDTEIMGLLPRCATRPNSIIFQEAIRCGNLKILKLLVESGAALDPTVLQMAAGCGYTSIVRLLLDNGADVDAEASQYGYRTALQVAAESGKNETVKLLLENGAKLDPTTLQAAVRYGKIDMVGLLLEGGADANTKPYSETSPTLLQVATQYGYTAIVKLLLENNADVNAKSLYPEGQTALQVAIKFKHPGIQRMLVDAGASDTSLWLALGRGFRNFIRSWGLAQAPN